jgi:hypothetical protein
LRAAIAAMSTVHCEGAWVGLPLSEGPVTEGPVTEGEAGLTGCSVCVEPKTASMLTSADGSAEASPGVVVSAGLASSPASKDAASEAGALGFGGSSGTRFRSTRPWNISGKSSFGDLTGDLPSAAEGLPPPRPERALAGADPPGVEARLEAGLANAATQPQLQMDGQIAKSPFSRTYSQNTRHENGDPHEIAKFLSRVSLCPISLIGRSGCVLRGIHNFPPLALRVQLPSHHGSDDSYRRQWTSSPNGIARSAGQQHCERLHRGL